MGLKDFTTEKLKREMKEFKKVGLISLAIFGASLMLVPMVGGMAAGAMQKFLSGVFFTSGVTAFSIGALYAVPSYLETKASYNKHMKFLEKNKNELTYADNQFENKMDKETTEKLDNVTKKMLDYAIKSEKQMQKQIKDSDAKMEKEREKEL